MSLADDVRRLEREVALLRRELARALARPGRTRVARRGHWYGHFTSSVDQGGTGTFEIHGRDGGEWELSGKTITVTDFFLQVGESIPSGAKGRVSWYEKGGVFVPDIWTCEASDTLPGEEEE